VIRVVLGDDSFLAREGIARVLETIHDVDLVAACGDLDELRTTVDREKPDAVVTDIRMPPTNTDEGIRFAGELRTSHPDVGVVVLSQHAEPSYAMSLFRMARLSGRKLLKEHQDETSCLARCGRWLPAARWSIRASSTSSSRARETRPGLEKLTPREPRSPR
jgi:DNA-binding NarL/FixJ family response regulator